MPRRPSRSAQFALAMVVLGVPTALLADSPEDTISRAPSGFVLHRRLAPTPGGTAGNGVSDGKPAPAPDDTPRFVYDPSGAGGIPSALPRDDASASRPSTALAPAPGEPVHTAQGLRPPEPSTATADPATGPKPATPIPAPSPGAPEDPSAPIPTVRETSATTAGGAADAVQGAADASGSDGTTAVSAAGTPGSDGAPGAPDQADPGAGPDAVAPGSDPRETMGDSASPDRHTQKEGTLHYHETFDPSIVPYKRGRALNVATDDFDIRLDPGRMEVLAPTGNRVDPGREVFWGSVLLEGEADARIPLPSVSPESRILSYEANPAQAIRFERDEAGNYYVTPERAGRLRLVFVMDAPTRYFGRALPAGVKLSDVPAALRPHLPRAVFKEARAVATAIGVPTDGDFAGTLNHLVRYFRSFKPGEPPPVTGSIYRDIALGQRGVCRHRAHAFVITAQALGIPTHYVFNEAHVFVEVWVPFERNDPAREGGARGSWLRVDLGGGADALEMQGGEGKSLHHPGPDPFDQPEGFDPDHAAGATRIDGLPTETTPAPKPDPAAHAGTPGAPAEPPDPSEPGGDGTPGARARGDPAPPGGTSPGVTRVTAAPDLLPTRTTLAMDQAIVFRGDSVTLRGKVEDLAGDPIREGQIHIVLLGAGGQAVADLGTVALGSDGRFALAVAVPATQAPGSYQLIAEFLGNGVHGPSVSE